MRTSRSQHNEQAQARRTTNAARMRISRARDIRRRLRRPEVRLALLGSQGGERHTIAAMSVVCSHCNAVHFQQESSRNCCHAGRVNLPALRPVPEEMQELFTGTDEKAENFRANIRNYNSACAFASMGADIDRPEGRGPYVFRIHGAIYHLTGALRPESGQRPKYS